MKIWIKLSIGIIIGVLLAIILPEFNGLTFKISEFISKLIIQIGKYAIFPLVFFSLTVISFELKQDKQFARVFGRSLLYTLLFTVVLLVLGIISALILTPERIPILPHTQENFQVPNLGKLILDIFPSNMFAAIFRDGNFLLPLFVLSAFLGINFTFDRLTTRPAFQLFDSMARIFYHIIHLIVELIGIGFISLATYFILKLKGAEDISLFQNLLILLSIDTLIVIFGVLPGLIYILGYKENPYKLLYGLIGPAISGIASGDHYFTLPFLTIHGKENLGVPRKVGAVTYPLYAIFGRGGAALVTSVSFILIAQSHSYLSINLFFILWLFAFTFLTSLILGAVPGAGVLVALTSLCSLSSIIPQEGYLILKSVIPFLLLFSVLIDTIASGFISVLIAHQEGTLKTINPRDFI
jgi:Na+/H+-dicarboxylate symporter